MPETTTTFDRPSASRPLRLYGVGQCLVLLGAWSIEASGSLVPMALAASASVMLTMPLVQHLWRSRRR